ncbi:MAG: succinate-semialdehyde dehydrogenase [Gammaproteobacteria bacterium]|nr:succinate-semialdehyde dehydrogenase [Gammaproteobacteria bacterium]|tara:strand:+ start:869 stop:2257 length:1389 start_codon:yes stop_codon:yes gene_type:complete
MTEVKSTQLEDASIQELVDKARTAQKEYELFSQETVDIIVRDIGKFVYDNAEELAKMAVEETEMGSFEDKVLKNKSKARVIWNNLKDKKSRGVIDEDKESNLVFVAKPMGVVAAVTPVTNPIVTPMCNGMFALKTGNAVIFAAHPKAQKCAEFLTQKFMKIVKNHDGPDDLIQVVTNGSVEKTQELMQKADVVVATGGGAMVKSAYSSGKPSFGVGAGNVPVIIDRNINLKDAVEKIVDGASFDHGIICSHEQFVFAPEECFDETIELFTNTGKVWFTDDHNQIQKLRDVVFIDGHLNKDVVGKSASEVGKLAGIEIPASSRLILLPADGSGTEDVLAKEKLCPVIAIVSYATFEDAISMAKSNLLVEGAGHSAALHSNDDENIQKAGLELPISRLVVNQPSSTSAGGSLTNGFAPTTTLGCGSWGGNSISENLDYKHLMNVSRIGKIISDKKVPTDDEIWA